MAGRPTVSAFRVVLSLTIVAVAALLAAFLADWAQLSAAVRNFWGQPWLPAALVLTYTGAFWLRAVAWRSLIVRRTSVFPLFVSMQAGLLVNHLAPLKLGELVRPLLAGRFGVPVAEAATTTAIARFLDFAALLAIAAVVGPIVSLSTEGGLWLRGLVLPAGVMLGCGAALVLVRRGRINHWLPGPCGPGSTSCGPSLDRCRADG